jgi:DNA-directed RNA polymerase subunit RPC12/RpoP
MTVHHVIRESDQKQVCPYCGSSTRAKSWSSLFDSNSHYKVLQCGCGRKITMKMGFIGSGHDSWGLDKKVEEAVRSERK